MLIILLAILNIIYKFVNYHIIDIAKTINNIWNAFSYWYSVFKLGGGVNIFLFKNSPAYHTLIFIKYHISH